MIDLCLLTSTYIASGVQTATVFAEQLLAGTAMVMAVGNHQ